MITILLEKIKALLIELKTNIENMPAGEVDYKETEHIVGKYGTDYVYEKTFHYFSERFPNKGAWFSIGDVPTNINRVLMCDKCCGWENDGKNVFSTDNLIDCNVGVTDGELTIAQYISNLYEYYHNFDLYITIRYTKNTEE